MGVARKAGDWAFKAFTAGLGVATVYLTATFSVNVYRGLAWHKAQTVSGASRISQGRSILHIIVISTRVGLKIGSHNAICTRIFGS
ncbi:hypothetical protein RJ640_005318 [Escallonia rubra]|uniref:Uncharacterized protein n=1 Tax=Escallonia rubra TaxID=112253 RepID=A0AA88QS93_9ASTE|nr:hypothetical protein RJ640_005318 [Escallonia rubra]